MAYGTLGSAYEYLVRYALNPGATSDLAILGAEIARMEAGLKRGEADWSDFGRQLHEEAACLARDLGISDGRARSMARMADISWTLALLTELTRDVGLRQSPLRVLLTNPPRAWSDFTGLMSGAAGEDLDKLDRVGREKLLPFLKSRGAPVVVGPSLDGPLAADCDLIVGRTLVEIKAIIGGRKTDGTPRHGLRQPLLYQVVGYALLAYEQYEINEVALFNARYGHLAVWPLDELLCQLAGRRVSTKMIARELISYLEESYPRGNWAA